MPVHSTLIVQGIACSLAVLQEQKTGILWEWQLSFADDALRTTASSETQDLCVLASICDLVICVVLHSVYALLLFLLKDSSEPPFRLLGSGYE